MAGTIKTNAVQLGDSATDSQNFLLKTNVDGTATLARGAAGSLGNVLTVDASSNVAVPQNLTVAGKISQTTAQSMVRLNQGGAGTAGYGSTNTAIRRFTNVLANQGTDITYADSATLGASFTINTNGVYAIHYSDNFSVQQWMGLSLDSTNLATSILSIPSSQRLVAVVSPAVDYPGLVSTTIYLPAGSVIRPHGNVASTESGTSGVSYFSITRVA